MPRTRRRSPLVATATVAALLVAHAVAQSIPSAGASSSDPLAIGAPSHLELTPLRLAIATLDADSHIVAFTVWERRQGTDLNSDGDMDDLVYHIYDSRTNTVTNLGLAADNGPYVSGTLVYCPVSEFGQGQTDFNGDGDVDDTVAFVYDASTRTLSNLGVAVLPFFGFTVSPDVVAVSVAESEQGNTDLNGDGDTDDWVLHVFDSRSGVTTNLGVAWFQGSIAPRADVVAFSVSEAYQGSADLNGDGDVQDEVLHLYDVGAGLLTNLELACRGRILLTGRRLLFGVGERAQGQGDLNGDGDDADDYVLHSYDLESRTVTNLQVAASVGQASDTLVAIVVSEINQGQTDLNADGDAADLVLHLYDSRANAVINLQRAAPFGNLAVAGDIVAFFVHEGSQANADLNGDGDRVDSIVHVYDHSTHSLTNTGLAVESGPGIHVAASELLVAFGVNERSQGHTDLNGDADTGDIVLHVFDVVSRTVRNTGLAWRQGGIPPRVQVNGDRVGVGVSEIAQGATDLNLDGDSTDRVFHVSDRTAGGFLNLRLSSSADPVIAPEVIALVASEAGQGNSDLNGDGDTNDFVLFVARVVSGPPCAAGTVNLASGPPATPLTLNGQAGQVMLPPNTPATLALGTSPAGPLDARYALWIWRRPPAIDLALDVAGSRLGCLVNPSPLHPGQFPQPFLCLRGGLPLRATCRTGRVHPSPARASWEITRPVALRPGLTLSIQGVLEDTGSASPLGLSVTNALAIILQ
jgi:hypothetical protein